ncbi:DNA repair protein RAD51 homolog 4-like [Nicotiana tabacum]|uniref:DNA repair protein RAD51 homolog 4-like n=4 Tax=Nicotiana TaxID=4085 RepID=A0AC58T8J3_TOBAC|nr:PREDICTED: DNA repair protein RAD51 homolog 4-like isoform X2 [Nicotiana sylvestris]
MNNIVCLSVFDIFTLFEVLHQLKNNLISQVDQHIRMIIIDSISTLITPILGGGGAQGHALMVSVGFLLKLLAHEHDICILVLPSQHLERVRGAFRMLDFYYPETELGTSAACQYLDTHTWLQEIELSSRYNDHAL